MSKFFRIQRAIITMITLLTAIVINAQVEAPDSLRLDSIRHIELTTASSSFGNIAPPSMSGYSRLFRPQTPILVENRVFHAKPMHPGKIASWYSGGISGYASSQSLPGMMGIEQGRISLYQSVGNFTFTAYGEALKYGFYRGLRTSTGFGGSVGYMLNDNVSFTVFGSYYTSPGSMLPSMAGYTSIPMFGGYADFSLGDRWGVQVGAQSYRSVMTQRWEPQPIVTPYFKLSKDAKIGIDVGGILYQLVRNNSFKRSRHMPNPTIPPPIP